MAENITPLMFALMMTQKDKKEDERQDIAKVFRTEIRALKRALMEKMNTPGKTYMLGPGGGV